MTDEELNVEIAKLTPDEQLKQKWCYGLIMRITAENGAAGLLGFSQAAYEIMQAMEAMDAAS